MIFYVRYAVGDGDGGEGGAIIESIISNARYAVGDADGGEGGASIESIIFYARYAVGDADGGEGGATRESILSNSYYAIWNGDGRECIASRESSLSNSCHAVSSAVVGNRFGDSGGSETKIVIVRPFFLICHLYGIRCRTAGNVVVQITRLKIIRRKSRTGKQCHEKSKDFSFHDC